jgi:hypothetical protein
VNTPALVGTQRRRRDTTITEIHEHHYHFDNKGVIGSQIELDNWLARSIDRLNTQRRLPRPRVA